MKDVSFCRISVWHCWMFILDLQHHNVFWGLKKSEIPCKKLCLSPVSSVESSHENCIQLNKVLAWEGKKRVKVGRMGRRSDKEADPGPQEGVVWQQWCLKNPTTLFWITPVWHQWVSLPLCLCLSWYRTKEASIRSLGKEFDSKICHHLHPYGSNRSLLPPSFATFCPIPNFPNPENTHHCPLM